MKRREFIALLSGAATWPLVARAQQPSGMRRIGVLLGNAESDAQGQASLAKFNKALQDLGWIVGRNIAIDYRWSAADLERMATFAKELVALKPDLIVGQTTPVIEALQRERSLVALCVT
jgi:putative ABC transport system substrate-binding protein